MKKTFFTVIFIFALYYNSMAAVAMIKSDVDTKLAMIKGSITIASEKNETIILSPYSDMQILSSDKRIKYNKKTNEYIISIDNLSPVIISYIKNISTDVDTINQDFISIYSSIIPAITNIEKAELFITLPENFNGLASQFVTFSKNKNTILFTYNSLPKNIYLAASNKYIIKKITQKHIDIYTLLFQEHENLSYKLLQKAAYYIEMYETLFSSNFPYHNFIVAEDINPYGHALASMAVFGTSIIDKDFITERSLGHEVLHQWFGAAIECNMTDGNFLEAVTTYFADYFYEKENRIQYRKDILEKYSAYAEDKSFPLKDFIYNAGKKEQAVGYGKGLMVLHMAKIKAGDDAFMAGIRNFIKDKMYSSASWKDLLAYLGMSSDFYNFWINNKNNVSIIINNASFQNNTLTFNLIRNGGEDKMDIPFTHISKNHTVTGKFQTIKGNNNIVYNLKSDNDTFIIDDRYDLMRNLYHHEKTPSFDYLFGAESILFAGAKNEDISFKKVFKNIDEVVHIRKLSLHHLKDKNVIISMNNTVPQSVAALLQNKLTFTFEMGMTTYKVVKNPYSNGDKFIIFSFNHTKNSLNKLTHYGSYSYITLKNDEVILKEKDNAFNGIKIFGK
ncbi:MAG: hypothetical protein MSA07_05730 [Mucispirillum sp.]|nr:hypothetical protein [Mucispirillum sp.]